jgi:hypothetical protein
MGARGRDVRASARNAGGVAVFTACREMRGVERATRPDLGLNIPDSDNHERRITVHPRFARLRASASPAYFSPFSPHSVLSSADAPPSHSGLD